MNDIDLNQLEEIDLTQLEELPEEIQPQLTIPTGKSEPSTWEAIKEIPGQVWGEMKEAVLQNIKSTPEEQIHAAANQFNIPETFSAIGGHLKGGVEALQKGQPQEITSLSQQRAEEAAKEYADIAAKAPGTSFATSVARDVFMPVPVPKIVEKTVSGIGESAAKNIGEMAGDVWTKPGKITREALIKLFKSPNAKEILKDPAAMKSLSESANIPTEVLAERVTTQPSSIISGIKDQVSEAEQFAKKGILAEKEAAKESIKRGDILKKQEEAQLEIDRKSKIANTEKEVQEAYDFTKNKINELGRERDAWLGSLAFEGTATESPRNTVTRAIRNFTAELEHVDPIKAPKLEQKLMGEIWGMNDEPGDIRQNIKALVSLRTHVNDLYKAKADPDLTSYVAGLFSKKISQSLDDILPGFGEMDDKFADMYRQLDVLKAKSMKRGVTEQGKKAYLPDPAKIGKQIPKQELAQKDLLEKIRTSDIQEIEKQADKLLEDIPANRLGEKGEQVKQLQTLLNSSPEQIDTLGKLIHQANIAEKIGEIVPEKVPESLRKYLIQFNRLDDKIKREILTESSEISGLLGVVGNLMKGRVVKAVSKLPSVVVKTDPIKTLQKIAKAQGISEKTAKAVETILKDSSLSKMARNALIKRRLGVVAGDMMIKELMEEENP